MVGEKNDVLAAAQQHLVSAHGHRDGPELEQNVTKVVNDHEQATPYASWV
jgi:hypothetical protein